MAQAEAEREQFLPAATPSRWLQPDKLKPLYSCPEWMCAWTKLGNLGHDNRLPNSGQSIWDLWRTKCHRDISVREFGFYIVNIITKRLHIFSDDPKQSSPVTGLEWPRGFQEVKVPRFHDNGTGWC
jgi:hypothetical protein